MDANAPVIAGKAPVTAGMAPETAEVGPAMAGAAPVIAGKAPVIAGRAAVATGKAPVCPPPTMPATLAATSQLTTSSCSKTRTASRKDLGGQASEVCVGIARHMVSL